MEILATITVTIFASIGAGAIFGIIFSVIAFWLENRK